MNRILRFAPLTAAALLLSACSFFMADGDAEETALAGYAVSDRCSVSGAAEDGGGSKALHAHTPSPDWAEQVIYMVQLDRFNDGDPSRNDQGQGEYDPSKESHYSGGDIAGLIEKIDYLKSLGVTTVLLSPFIANKWTDPGNDEYPPYTGYHGYWPVSFIDMDAHLGSIDDLKELSARLHENGMYLLMDVIANHTAHYYNYVGPYSPDDVTENFEILAGQVPPRPIMPPFHQNDVRNPRDRAADIYHWTPPITNYFDPDQIERYQLELVNDLNTSNPEVRSALKQAYKCWIEAVGFDGVRIDAAKHVETAFWSDFLYADDGLLAHARQLGKDDFLTYGEIWNISPPYETSAEAHISKYIETGEKTGFRTAMGFPFFSSINKAVNAYKPTDILSFRMSAQMSAYPDPYLIINFLDSHDVVRFLSVGDTPRFRKALAIMLTAPGIPLLYQGDEQGFSERRQAMFAGGYLSEEDQFDENSELYRTIKALTEVRRSGNGVFTRGSFKSLNANPIGPGVFAFERRNDTHAAFVIVNTSSEFSTLVNALPTGLAPGSMLKTLYSVGVDQASFVVGETGTLTFSLPPDATVVLLHDPAFPAVETARAPTIEVEQAITDKVLKSDMLLEGKTSAANARIRVVLDGDVDAAATYHSDDAGKWSATLPAQDMLMQPHFVELYMPDHNVATSPDPFISDRSPDRQASAPDPSGDDVGPTGGYSKPVHPSVGMKMDIIQTQVRTTDDQMIVSITMNELTDHWSYPNGFENVSFHIYFDDAELLSASTDLPWIDAQAPDGFDWDLANSVFGFGNAVYENKAGEAELVAEAAPAISIDDKTIHLRYDCAKLPINCANHLKIYVTTWDRDQEGALRELREEPDIWIFGRTDDSRAKIIDAAMLSL